MRSTVGQFQATVKCVFTQHSYVLPHLSARQPHIQRCPSSADGRVVARMPRTARDTLLHGVQDKDRYLAREFVSFMKNPGPMTRLTESQVDALGLSDAELHAAAKRLCQLRQLSESPENLNLSLDEIVRFREVEIAINSTTDVY